MSLSRHWQHDHGTQEAPAQRHIHHQNFCENPRKEFQCPQSVGRDPDDILALHSYQQLVRSCRVWAMAWSSSHRLVCFCTRFITPSSGASRHVSFPQGEKLFQFHLLLLLHLVAREDYPHHSTEHQHCPSEPAQQLKHSERKVLYMESSGQTSPPSMQAGVFRGQMHQAVLRSPSCTCVFSARFCCRLEALEAEGR